MSSRVIERIAVVVAMEKEFQSLLASEHFVPWVPTGLKGPYRFLKSKMSGIDIVFALNGEASNRAPRIGTVPAALTTLKVIELFDPQLVISAGTAGGFEKRGAQIGDLYLSTAIYYHDRRVAIPGFHEWLSAGWPVLHPLRLASALKVKTGVVTTGDSFDLSFADSEQMEHLKTDAKEMEAAAVAYVCDQYQVPFLALKAITDIVDSKVEASHPQFLRNLQMCSDALCAKVPELIQLCAKKTISELSETN